MGLVIKTFTIYYSLFTRLRFRWWSEIAVCNESRTRGIILLCGAPHPQITLSFLRSFDDVIALPASGRNCDLPLQICAVKFHICRSEPIQNNLRRVAIMIPLTARNDRYFGLYSTQQILGGGILRAMVSNLKNLCLKIQILGQHPVLRLFFCIARQQH